MKINDYIKDATSKIFDIKEKHMVEAELTDHILCHKHFNEEIGYDAEKAEEMAVERMGDAAEISEQLGSLHNDFYTPVGDIIAAIIWLLLLGGAFYLLKEYIFDDIGAIAISLSSILATIGIFLINSFTSMKRNRIPICIMNFIGGAGTTVFTYLVSKNISKNVGSINNLIKLLFNCSIPKTAEVNNTLTIVLTSVSLLMTVIITLITISYSIKLKNCNNKLSDNHFNKAASNIVLVLSITVIIAGIICSTRFFAYQNSIKEKYYNDYILALDIADKCKTTDDVTNYINNNSEKFSEIKQKKKITGYTYNSDVGNIIISFNIEENEIEQKQTAYEKLIKRFANAIIKAYPESAEKQYDYIINFTAANLSKYKNGYDSISLAKLRIQDTDLDQIYNFTATERSNEEILEFLNTYIPKNLYITPSNNKYTHDSELVYTFTAGKGDNSFDTDFNITLQSEKLIKINEQKNEIIKFLTDNPDAGNDDIINRFNCKLLGPDYSYNEFKSTANSVFAEISDEDLSFTDEELTKYYNSLFSFQLSDDLIFTKSRIGYPQTILFSSHTNIKYFSVEFAGETSAAFKSSYGGNWRKTRLEPENIYFDCNGLKYKSKEDIPYYTKNNQRYRFYFDEENNLYYLIGTNGKKYEANYGYIDENGNLYFFTDSERPKSSSQNEFIYHDKDGKSYTKALETNWDENGNLIHFEDYLPTSEE